MSGLAPHRCAVRAGGLSRLLVVAIYSSSITAGLAVAIVLLVPLFKRKSKAI
jgi:hypothetical protein